MDTQKPPRLKKGDLIGVVAPASPVTDTSKIERGVRYVESLGYRVVMGKHVERTTGYLAGSDAERAEDLHGMFRNRNVRAIFCLRGGYGTPRLLPLLDYKLIARNPKILVGYSDITALQLALWRKCRLVSFHGPMFAVEMAGGIHPSTGETFWRLVTSPQKAGILPTNQEAPSSLYPGIATGRLLGGNLSMVVTVLGTPYEPDFKGSVLFLEEIGEEPYRVDRMLMQLRNASVLSNTRAILAGQFTDCVPADTTKPSFSVAEILHDTAASSKRPFLPDLPFGHTDFKLTLPIGIRARVDAADGSVALLEGAVV